MRQEGGGATLSELRYEPLVTSKNAHAVFIVADDEDWRRL